jgi:cytochrome P450
MTLFPEVQAKAREEIDRVLGCDELPNWNDRARLPYIEAMIAELLRWKPIAPLALPHCASEDGEYRGYFIPKGNVTEPADIFA